MRKVDTEFALYVTNIEDLKHYERKYTRLYYGNEFCQRLIPTQRELGLVLDFVKDNHLAFTLVTPYVTDNGLAQWSSILSTLNWRKEETEVVFNDWGVLAWINEAYPRLVPVMGRLLNKMKRGPRLMHFLEIMPQETVDYLRTCSLDVPVFQKFLTQNRVQRAELDNVLQGIGLDLGASGIHLSLHAPYAYVTTTRLCLASRCEDSEIENQIGIFPCGRECRKYAFTHTHPVLPTPLIGKGNTKFIKNECIPDDIESQGVDRIVYEPEIPM